jgi:rhamnosyltransferase
MPSEDNVPLPQEPGKPERRSDVACVITAFHPSSQIASNVQALLVQARTVIVVDDGSGSAFDKVFEDVAAAGADVVRLPENSGIGAALNAGIHRAREDRDVRYVLTVDQDSILPSGYVESLLAAEAAARAKGVVAGLVGPARIHGNPVLSGGTRNGVALGKEPIQSGLLVSVEALERLGDFRAELFIDLVDTEFYLRALDAGLPTVLADTEFDHSLGTFVEARIFGRPLALPGGPLKVRIAAPWRYYYIFRNRILVSRLYARRHPAWVAAGCWADLRHLAVVTALAPGRLTRLTAVVAGLSDGLRGRTGKKPGT